MVSFWSVVNRGFTADLSRYTKAARIPQAERDKAVKTDKSDAQMLAKTLAFRS
jgi:hypothetical protein